MGGKCRVIGNGRFNPKSHKLPVDIINCSNVIVEKYPGKPGIQGIGYKEQYEQEKQCLLLLKKNYIDLNNIKYYPFTELISEHEDELKLVISFCGDSIKNILTYTREEVLFYFKNINLDVFKKRKHIVENIMYNLRCNYMYHLDIKTANVCVTSDGTIRLVDLGLIVINKSDNIYVPYIDTPWSKTAARKINRTKYFNKITTKMNSVILELEKKLKQCII